MKCAHAPAVTVRGGALVFTGFDCGRWRRPARPHAHQTRYTSTRQRAPRQPKNFYLSIHRDSVSDNSTAILSVAPTCLVAEERDATDDEREDAHRGGAGRHGRTTHGGGGGHRPEPLRAAGLPRAGR